MKLLGAALVVLNAIAFAAEAQIAGGGNGMAGNRPGGISFVTRRLPTSGVGVGANGFFTAGGVTTAATTVGVGGTAAVPPAVAATTQPPPALADARVQAALRISAAQGNADAKRLLEPANRPAQRPSPVSRR